MRTRERGRRWASVCCSRAFTFLQSPPSCIRPSTHTLARRPPAGTNDAKDPGDGGPANWPAGACLDANGAVTLAGCRFADDYAAMIEVVRGLGTTPGVPPAIYVAVPPPLMQHGSIGANQVRRQRRRRRAAR